MLIRLALETALDGHWDSAAPELRQVSRRSQFLVLSQSLDQAEARRAEVLWASLSQATHHQAYELAPTAAELRTWEREARVVVDRLAAEPVGVGTAGREH